MRSSNSWYFFIDVFKKKNLFFIFFNVIHIINIIFNILIIFY